MLPDPFLHAYRGLGHETTPCYAMTTDNTHKLGVEGGGAARVGGCIQYTDSLAQSDLTTVATQLYYIPSVMETG